MTQTSETISKVYAKLRLKESQDYADYIVENNPFLKALRKKAKAK